MIGLGLLLLIAAFLICRRISRWFDRLEREAAEERRL
jgi:hypothetical protein